MLGLVTSGQQCGILLSSKNGFDATGFYNSFHSLILTGSIIHYLATKSQIGFASYTYIYRIVM